MFSIYHKRGYRDAKYFLKNKKMNPKNYAGLLAELSFYNYNKTKYDLTPSLDAGDKVDFTGIIEGENTRIDVTTNTRYKFLETYDPFMHELKRYCIALWRLKDSTHKLININFPFCREQDCEGRLFDMIIGDFSAEQSIADGIIKVCSKNSAHIFVQENYYIPEYEKQIIDSEDYFEYKGENPKSGWVEGLEFIYPMIDYEIVSKALIIADDYEEFTKILFEVYYGGGLIEIMWENFIDEQSSEMENEEDHEEYFLNSLARSPYDFRLNKSEIDESEIDIKNINVVYDILIKNVKAISNHSIAIIAQSDKRYVEDEFGAANYSLPLELIGAEVKWSADIVNNYYPIDYEFRFK